jgi:hypothetical protein
VSALLTRTGPAKRSPDEAPHGIREWQEVAGFAGTFADHFRGVGVEVLQGTFHLLCLALDLHLHVTVARPNPSSTSRQRSWRCRQADLSAPNHPAHSIASEFFTDDYLGCTLGSPPGVPGGGMTLR